MPLTSEERKKRRIRQGISTAVRGRKILEKEGFGGSDEFANMKDDVEGVGTVSIEKRGGRGQNPDRGKKKVVYKKRGEDPRRSIEKKETG